MTSLRAALLIALLPCAALAQDDALTTLLTGDDAAGWEAVGRIDIDGKGFCTGALIAPDLVLTAAHCLFDRESGGLVTPDRFEFLAGLRNGRALAYRDVARAIAHPDYALPGLGEPGGSANDVALLVLTQPIRSTQVTPFDVLPDAQAGDRVSVVSYAHDRAEAPALQAVCDRLGTQDGLYVLSCDVDYGSSGAPVFQIDDGVARIVSVISAKAEYEGERVAIASQLDAPLAELGAELARGYGGALSTVRVLAPGERNDTGARFVRP
jgi:protease YdgD